MATDFDYTYGILKSLYNERGAQDLLALSGMILDGRRMSKERRITLVGYLAEAICMLYVEEYLSRKSIQAKVYHSVYVDKADGGIRNTEIDVVVASAPIIICFECKSYKGTLHLVGKGGIHRTKGNDADVYSQSLLHHEFLHTNLSKFSVLPSNCPMVSCGFLFSDAKVRDERTEEDRRGFQIISLRDMETYLDVVFAKYQIPAYDYQKMVEFFDSCTGSRATDKAKRHAQLNGYELK